MKRARLLQTLTTRLGVQKKQKKNRSVSSAQPKLQACFLAALACYPELCNVDVQLKTTRTIFLMETRPSFPTLLGLRKTYIIYIKQSKAHLLAKHFCTQGLQGLLGHELGHILDYQRRNLLGHLWFGLRYLFPACRLRIELENELRTFNHGLGYQMLAYLKDMEQAPLPPSLKQYRHKYYLRENELKELLRQTH